MEEGGGETARRKAIEMRELVDVSATVREPTSHESAPSDERNRARAVMTGSARCGCSLQLAEDGSEGDGEDFPAELVGDAQLPAAPVFRVGRHQRGAHATVGVREGPGKIAHGGAASVDQFMTVVGAMEMDFGRASPPTFAFP